LKEALRMIRRIACGVVVLALVGCGGTNPPPPVKATPAPAKATTDETPKTEDGKGDAPATPKAGPKPGKKPAGNTTTPVKKTSALPGGANVQLASLVLSVPDMACEFNCAPKVRKTLESVAGVSEVKTDVEGKLANLKIDPTKFDLDKALAALKDAHYPATVKK
jgi:copper chaperone CopZ